MKDLKNVLVGLDFSAPSENALREAARIANWNDATLTAVHVFDEDVLKELRRYAPEIEGGFLAQAEGSMATSLDGIMGETHGVQSVFMIGHPLQGMIKMVKEHSADLLVIGSHGHTSSDSHRVGIHASRCIRKAPVNVLLVRERQVEPFKKIVACVDFSPTSIKAAVHAAHMARQDEASLELVHINPTVEGLLAQTSFFTAVEPPTAEDYEEKNRERLQTCLDDFASEVMKRAGEVTHTTTILNSPDPHGKLIDHLNETQADLVVLGTRGSTSLQNLLLGSTAEKIIHRAPCCALAVKPDGFDYELE